MDALRIHALDSTPDPPNDAQEQQPRRRSLSASGSGKAILVWLADPTSTPRNLEATSLRATSWKSSETPVFCFALVSNISAPIDAAYCAAVL
mmetsp:Transcript_58717/g.130837  ORF Transcript_58717/g.130837 Transcript_58717/m.130837 type:complete len:92 (+) Transcript_58717:379-654(+)